MHDFNRAIAVVDFTQAGHVPMYHTCIVKALLQNGELVFSLCPWQEQVRRSSQDFIPDATNRLITPSSILTRNVIPSKAFGKYLLYLPLRHKIWPIIRANCLLRAYRTYNRWKSAGLLVRACSNHHKHIRFNIMITCLDEFVNPLISTNTVDRLVGFPWSGIHLGTSKYRLIKNDNELLRQDNIFLSKTCLGIGNLDHGMTERWRNYLPNKKVIDMPECTDSSLPSLPPASVTSILKRAEGRPIIGLLGMLQPRKGLKTLLEVIEMPSAKNYFFLLCGGFSPIEFTPKIAHALHTIEHNGLSNAHAILNRIENESEFNAIFKLCDIVFAAYIDFVYSSGMFSKAAIFRIPLIVSTGFYAEEWVKQYRVGLAIPQRNAKAALHAIDFLLKAVDLEGNILNPDYDTAARNCSLSKLGAALKQLFD